MKLNKYIPVAALSLMLLTVDVQIHFWKKVLRIISHLVIWKKWLNGIPIY